MLPAGVCRSLMECLDDELTMDAHDHTRVFPPIARFGPGVNDFRTPSRLLGASYWDRAAAARSDWARAALTPDPLTTITDAIATAWGLPVRPASVSGRQVFAGIVREIHGGAHVHDDEVVREFVGGLFDEPLLCQLAFNLFVCVPESGGELTVWRRRWTPDDEQHRRSEFGYGYEPGIVARYPSVTVSAQFGEGVFFDPRNYHAVAASANGRRVSVAFFLGVTPTGHLTIWS